MNTQIPLLLVEDNPTDRLIIREYLSEAVEVSFLLDEAQSMHECVQRLNQKKYAAILLDLGLPDSRGEQSLLQIIEVAPNTPLLVLTGMEDEQVGIRAMRLGAQDYLVKGEFRSFLLIRAVRYAVERHRIANELRELASQLGEASRRLSESEARFREMINVNQDAMIVVDDQNVIQFANPAASRIMGKPHDELAGTAFPYDWKNNDGGELRIPGRGGEVRFIDLRSATTEWDDCPTQLLTLRDVTEKRKLEKDLLLFRYLVDNADESFEVVDAETGRLIDCNDTCCKRLGYTREEMLKLHVWEYDVNVTKGDWCSIIKGIMGVDVLRFQARHLSKDGNTYPVEVSAAKVVMGDKTYLVAVVQDITERLRIEKQLLRDAEILSRIEDAILVLDMQFRITFWNDGATRLLGHTNDERVGTLFIDNFSSSERDEIQYILNDTIQKRDTRIERKLTCKCGNAVWVEMDIQVTTNDSDEPIYVMLLMRNINERRSLEAQLRQAQKMEAIGTLAGGIAHDFNNIMAAVRGYAELAQRRCTDELVSRDLETVLKASTRATSLIEKIMTFSRKQPETRVPIHLHEALNESVHLLRATLPTTISIETDIDETTPTVLANYEQILQIILNLGTNALHAMPDQAGILTIRLGRRHIDQEKSFNNLHLQPGDYVCISIRDTGDGMDAETIERIFEPFFTTKNPGEGTGLGLAMVHGIMQSHDGAISIESKLGEGAIFSLYFPVIGLNVKELDSHGDTEPKGQGEKILFVDDEELLAALGKEALETIGYEVTTCCDPKRALMLVKEAGMCFDLIVTDQTMPGMTGLDLCRKILKFRPEQKIIISTGYSASLTPATVRAAGIQNILLKPVSIDKLSHAVRNALDTENINRTVAQ